MPTAPRPGAVAMATLGSVRCARSVAAFIKARLSSNENAASGTGPIAASSSDGRTPSALDDLGVRGLQALGLLALDAAVDHPLLQDRQRVVRDPVQRQAGREREQRGAE